MKYLLLASVLMLGCTQEGFAQPQKLMARHLTIHKTPVRLELWDIEEAHQIRVYVDGIRVFDVEPIADNFSEHELKRVESFMNRLTENELDGLTDGTC